MSPELEPHGAVEAAQQCLSPDFTVRACKVAGGLSGLVSEPPPGLLEHLDKQLLFSQAVTTTHASNCGQSKNRDKDRQSGKGLSSQH